MDYTLNNVGGSQFNNITDNQTKQKKIYHSIRCSLFADIQDNKKKDK